ncbi:MAG: hypothetical protein KatS3mg129_1509 [Leptospiraceae bacterium]|nr:MAG: hypothetical protein KatS3mg129_1509 [Leptospiraceae bacterium]
MDQCLQLRTLFQIVNHSNEIISNTDLQLKESSYKNNQSLGNVKNISNNDLQAQDSSFADSQSTGKGNDISDKDLQPKESSYKNNQSSGFEELKNILSSSNRSSKDDHNCKDSEFDFNKLLGRNNQVLELQNVNQNTSIKNTNNNNIVGFTDSLEKRQVNEFPFIPYEEKKDNDNFKPSIGIELTLSIQKITKENILMFYNIFKNSKKMKEITDYLGRKEMVKRMEKYKTTKSKMEVNGQDKETIPIIDSVKLGNNINLTVSSDFLYSVDKELEDIFDYKFIENQLNIYKLKSVKEIQIDKTQFRKRNSPGLGPVFIIIDTSGSMEEWDIYAKSILYTLIKYIKYKNRACYLINFSVEHTCLDLVKLYSENNLLTFLTHSYYGGTDINSSIKEVYNNIKRKEFYNSDLLIMSDFMMNYLSETSINYIKELKENYQMRFFGILFNNFSWKVDYEEVDIDLLLEDSFNSKDNNTENEYKSLDIINYVDEYWSVITSNSPIDTYKKNKYNLIEEIKIPIDNEDIQNNKTEIYLYFGKSEDFEELEKEKSQERP